MQIVLQATWPKKAVGWLSGVLLKHINFDLKKILKCLHFVDQALKKLQTVMYSFWICLSLYSSFKKVKGWISQVWWRPRSEFLSNGHGDSNPVIRYMIFECVPQHRLSTIAVFILHNWFHGNIHAWSPPRLDDSPLDLKRSRKGT